ncbi:MAG: DUF2341 domain-containing protein [Byssovorax sp.]
MKRLVPWALLAVAVGASCTLDLAGKPGGNSSNSAGGGASATTTTASVATGGSTGATTGPGGAGGSSVSSSDASSSSTGGGPAWTRRRELDLDCGFDAKIDDFAALVLLKTNRIDYAATRSNGEDLRFTDLNDNALPYEIERWIIDGVSIVWVRLPTLTQAGSTHTKIRMYYGNPAADDNQNPEGIWKASYAGVWHLSQDNNALADSTGKTPLATNHGSTRVVAIVGDGRSFSAVSGDYIDTLNAVNVKRFTVEAFAKGTHNASTGSGPNGPLMRQKNYQIMWDHINPFVAAASLNTKDSDPMGENWKTADFQGLNGGTWYYLAATFEGNKLHAYKDGVPTDTKSFGMTDPQPEPETAKIGRHAFDTNPANFFDGEIDEVRVSTKVRADDWIKVQNKSMRDQGFVGFGTEETGSYKLP